MRFLLIALMLVLAGWGAAAEHYDIPKCEAVAYLSESHEEGYIYQCGGCAFVILNDNHSLLLGCGYGKQRSGGGKQLDWSKP